MEKDAVADLLKQPLDKRYCHGLTDKVKMFQNKAETHQQSQEKNPFSAQWLQKDRKGVGANYVPQKGDPEYGRPPSGSKTEFRGLKAHSHVTKEMLELCEIIHENAEYSDGELDGISFGELFKIYTNISNKVVGILLRGRKHQYLHFEGETLFQFTGFRGVDQMISTFLGLHPRQLSFSTSFASRTAGKTVVLNDN